MYVYNIYVLLKFVLNFILQPTARATLIQIKVPRWNVKTWKSSCFLYYFKEQKRFKRNIYMYTTHEKLNKLPSKILQKLI